MQQLTNETFNKVLKESIKPVVVKFGAEWCLACNDIEPEFEKLAEEMPEVSIYAVDTKLNKEVVNQFIFKFIPTIFIFYAGGSIVAQSLCAGWSKDELKTFIKLALKGT